MLKDSQRRVLLALALFTGSPAVVGAEPAAFFRGTHLVAGAETLGDGARLRTRESGFDAGVGGGTLAGGDLSIGLDYRYTRYELTGLDTRDWDLHWLRVPLGWRRVQDGDGLVATLAPGIASSSNRFNEPAHYTRDDLDMAAKVLAVREGAGDVRWIAGLLLDRRFGRSRLYPSGGAIFEPAGGWTLRLVVPDPGVVFEQSTRLRWFAAIEPAGHRWHAEEAGRDFEFETRAWRAALGGEFSLGGRLSIRLFAGREFDRRFALVDDAGAAVELDADDATFAGLSLATPAFAGGRP